MCIYTYFFFIIFGTSWPATLVCYLHFHYYCFLLMAFKESAHTEHTMNNGRHYNSTIAPRLPPHTLSPLQAGLDLPYERDTF